MVGVALGGIFLACGTADESAFDDGPGNSDSGTSTTTGGNDGGGVEFTGNLDGSLTLPDAGSTVVQAACTKNEDCGDAGVCNLVSKTCGCGGVAVNAEVAPPNLLIMLDRSCSMNAAPDTKVDAGPGGKLKTKWEIAQSAIATLTKQYKGKIRFGLELFPDVAGDVCDQAVPVPVPVAANQESTINDLLFEALTNKGAGMNYFPNYPCVTNINYAVATSVGQLTDSTRKNFSILMTDGAQSGCAMPDAGDSDIYTKTIIANQHAAGVDTFVIGFGGGVDKTALNSFALAGGQPNPAAPPDAGADPTPPFYYDAADEAQLTAALASIAKRTLSCTMKLASSPPGEDVSLINIFLDANATPVPLLDEAGTHWSYDTASKSITFLGADCEALKEGKIGNVSVVFGCPGLPPPPPPTTTN